MKKKMKVGDLLYSKTVMFLMLLFVISVSSEDLLDRNQNNAYFAKYYECPVGWVLRCEKCYLLVETAKTWTDARYYCKKHGGELVTVKDDSTNFFLARYVQQTNKKIHNVYIGLHDREKEGDFKWSDGSEAIEKEFRWLPGEPHKSLTNENCVEMFTRSNQYLWNDAPCSDELSFICQMPACVQGSNRCDNGKCVSKQAICDGVDDCGDSSDEKNCTKCGGYLNGMTGTFQSPNYPDKYGNNRRCSWVIEVPTSHKIQLAFKDFGIETGFDYVEIFDGKTLAAKSFGRFNGDENPELIMSTSNQIRVTLVSDMTTSFKGFLATFKAIPDKCEFDLVIPKNGYEYIKSPMYPDNYPDNKKCIWNIRSEDPFGTLTMMFVELDTEENNDFIEVRDGKGVKDLLLGRFSGENDVKFMSPIFSTAKHMFVKFQSNYMTSKKGFRAIIRSGCYAEINASQGMITSPGFPYQHYPKLIQCTWKINEPDNKAISFMFHRFDTELNLDVLYIKDKSGKIVGTYSGVLSNNALQVQWILETSQSSLEVTFTSDVTYTMSGFNVTFSKGCPAISVLGGKVKGKSHYGGKISYECDEGYHLRNGKTRTCLYSGKWSDPMPYCAKINCGHPGVVVDGGFQTYPKKDNFDVNTRLVYYCDAGYRLIGNNERVCQNDSTWSGSQPECKLSFCDTLTTPKNGKIVGDDFTVGQSVTIKCNPGFNIVGVTTLTCGKDGKWNADEPVCEAVTCPIIKPSDNMEVLNLPNNTDRFPYGAMFDIKCKNGFELNGENQIKCVAPGIWSPKLPKCYDVNECLQKSSACKGVGHQCINTIGSFKCECKNGYQKNGANTCQDIDECKISNATVKCSQKCINQLGTYKCDCEEGYYLYSGDNSTVSRIELRTAVVNHTCYGVRCSVAPIPDNGFVINYGRRHPVRLIYQCDRGFVIKGNEMVMCQKDGTWNREFPDCVHAGCQNVTVAKSATFKVNGTKLSDGRYKLGTEVIYTCARGFKITSGNLRQECIQNTTHAFWSGELPVCERKSCPTLTAPVNGKVSSMNNLFESEATFTCDDGFQLLGDAKLTCTESGKWSGATPVCAASSCPYPDVPKYGEFVGRLELGRRVIYSCYKTGYTLVGNKERTCLYKKGTGHYWTGDTPLCKDITPPVFTCTKQINVQLPRSENSMLVKWDVPTATDSTGKRITVTVSPDIHPPAKLKAGQHNIVYTATDKAGNNATCTVVVNVQDKQIPRIKCPPNVEIESDFPAKVTWDSGLFSDNVGISRVSFNPSNGSTFQSGKYHRVEMTVEDLQGNRDVCVTEVYVKGCGCESNKSCNSIAPHNGGISTCHINMGITSCSLTCPKGLSFVQDNFKHDNVMCLPQGKWSEKDIPGCGERKSVTSCLNAVLEFEYNTIDTSKVDEDNLATYFNDLFKNFGNMKTTYCDAVKFIPNEYELKSKNIELLFKMEPKGDILKDALKEVLEGCKTELENRFQSSKQDILNLVSHASVNLQAKSIIKFDAASCCGDSKYYCCPKGHSVRAKGANVENIVCLPCSPGMFLNASSNHCTSCPKGYFTDTSGNEACQKCPDNLNTLKHQSTKCTEKCPLGTYSSTGLQPTCRKCDYGEYQNEVGQTMCMVCPSSTTTASRGSQKLEDCKAPCQLGHYSDTGLKPCVPCEKGTYQNETGRSVCKACPSGGIYAGIEGATKEEECPSDNACDMKLCKNEAKCVPGVYSYQCLCKPGYKGKNCEIDIDECETKPCKNNGTCVDLVNDYNCTCIPGLTGKSCETNVNDCKNDTCINAGVCEDLINDYKCWCPLGWEGIRCEKFINKCLSSPCQHKSKCTPLLNAYKCDCTPGYKGHDCETDINECQSSPCYNNATCVDLLNDFECKCQPGFKGELCAIDINECVGSPCFNNATCIDGINGYRCECQPGFAGQNCSINVNECDTKPCLRNSTCIDLINKFKCECEPGFYGDRCEFEINECEDEPCKNNATCIDQVNAFECLCPLGYKGVRCETEINECDVNPCKFGTCIDLIGDYRCNCTPGYEGRNCDILIDNCVAKPCENNATCTNQVHDYSCKCLPGYEGKNCSIDTNECLPDPCNGNALNCTDIVNGYICYCKPGFRGTNCSEEINNCIPQPCMHNSTCKTIIETNDYQCNCTAGYEGKQCENETNECLGSPCQNNATCIDKLATYECVCPTGFTGFNCETNIDDCKNVTCQNNGMCFDKINDYYCRCHATHKGRHCEKKIPDEVDIKLPGGTGSVIIHSNISTVQEFSLSIWVRYLGSNSRGDFLILANSNGKVMTSHFLKLSHQRVMVEFNGNMDIFSLDKMLNDGLWHHVFVSMSGLSSKIVVALDSKVIIEETKSYLNGQSFFKPSGYLIIGKNVNRTGFFSPSGFAGEISQLAIWNRVLSPNEMNNLASNCSVDLKDSIIPWVGLLDNAGSKVELLERWTCGTNVCPAGFMGRFCEILIDKVAPTVASCPKSKKVVSLLTSTRVNWPEPRFDDNVAVTEITRSHAPDQVFGWGDYVISYIAKDAFNNSATCVFELYVTPYDCPDLEEPNHSASATGRWLWGLFFDFQCKPNYELAVPKPPFYSCGKMGTWSHGPPTYMDNPKNLLPSCTGTARPIVIGTNAFTYSTTSKCDETFKAEFMKQFKRKVLEIHQYFKICGEKCDFANIRVKCTDEDITTSRVKRDASQNEVKVYFDSKFNESLSNSFNDTQTLQAAIKNDKVDLSFTVGGETITSDKNNVDIAEPKLACNPGWKFVKDKCVLCPAGTYRDSSMIKCELCEAGSYSSLGSATCVKCPHPKITYGTGAKSMNECYENCSSGYYFNNGSCSKCQIGFYKSFKGLEECTQCPKGTTTTVIGASRLEDCSVECPLGHELVGTECQPCMNGYYRSNKNQPECLPCPYGTTTYLVGSASNICYKKCELGFESSNDGKVCMPCNTGYYREEEIQRKCLKCSGDKITLVYGAKSKNQCKEQTGTKFDVELRFTSLEWNNTLIDEDSAYFRATAYNIANKIAKIYENDKALLYIKIINFSEGSVIANMTISFEKEKKDPLEVLRKTVATGKLDGLSVDPDSFKTDRCEFFDCPKDRVCWYNSTGRGCKCKPGFYETSDGKCFAGCEPDYCLNGGACVESDSGRNCRCSKEYSGERCEKEEKDFSLALIIGLVVVAILILLLLCYCLRRRKRSGNVSLYKYWKSEDKEHGLSSIPNTPIVQPVKGDNGDIAYAAENKLVEKDDEEQSESSDRK